MASACCSSAASRHRRDRSRARTGSSMSRCRPSRTRRCRRRRTRSCSRRTPARARRSLRRWAAARRSSARSIATAASEPAGRAIDRQRRIGGGRAVAAARGEREEQRGDGQAQAQARIGVQSEPPEELGLTTLAAAVDPLRGPSPDPLLCLTCASAPPHDALFTVGDTLTVARSHVFAVAGPGTGAEPPLAHVGEHRGVEGA